MARENNKEFKIKHSGNQGSLFGPPPNTSIDARPENSHLDTISFN
jgi:hypothetical protein